MLTDHERRVLDAIDADAVAATLQRLVAVPSVDGTPGELAVQRLAAAELTAQGLDTELWPIDLPTLREHPRFPGAEVPRDEALGVTALLAGNGGGPRLLLNGHLDVVPPGDESLWQHSPWSGTIANGRLYGRGACDMKGGVAAAFHAAGALARSGIRLRGDLLVSTVVGEEDGGLGAFAASLRGPGCDAAIIVEPTALQPTLAQAGALTFRLLVPGRAAHGAMRLEGYSALDAYLPLHQAIKELEAERNRDVAHPLMGQLALPYPISIGIVQAGEWASTVPEQLVVEGRFGVVVGEPPEQARAALVAALGAAATRDPWLHEHPPQLVWWGGQFESAVIDQAHPLVQTIDAALADYGITRSHAGVSWGSDMRLLQHVGEMPTLLWGPGDVRLAHQRDESIALAEVLDATRLFALTALRFLA